MMSEYILGFFSGACIVFCIMMYMEKWDDE